MLVQLELRAWNAEREDKERANEIALKYGADARMGKYKRYLIDPDALKPILKVRGEIRNKHYELTLPWSNDGGRIITTAGFLKYRDVMSEYKGRYLALASDFADVYPTLIAGAAKLLNGLYRQEDYPSAESIRNRFGMYTRFLPVPESNDFRADLSADDIAVIRAEIDSQNKLAVSEAMEDCARRIREVVSHMADRLKAYSVAPDGKISNPFRDSLVENMRDLVSILPGLNLTGDSTITRLQTDMEQLTRWDAGQLRENDGLRVKVSADADAILKRMGDYGL